MCCSCENRAIPVPAIPRKENRVAQAMRSWADEIDAESQETTGGRGFGPLLAKEIRRRVEEAEAAS